MRERSRCGLRLRAVAVVLGLLAACHGAVLRASVDPGPDGRPRPERTRWQTGTPGIDEQAAGMMIAIERAFDANEPRAALTMLAKLRELRPRDPTVWNSVGYALVQLKDLPGAAAAYQKSLDVDPTYAEGAYNLALAFIDLDRLDDARRSLQPWTSRIREYPVLGVLLAQIEQSRGQHASARGFIDQVLAAPKIKPLVLFEAANLLKNWNDRRAEDAFRRVMAEDPKMIGAALNLANIMRNSGRSDDARKILDDLARRMPDHPSVLRERGGLNVQEGRLEEAVFDLDRAVAKRPEMTEASIVAAECLVKLGRPRDALLRLEPLLDATRPVPEVDRAAARKLREAILRTQAAAMVRGPQPSDQQGAVRRWLAATAGLEPRLAALVPEQVAAVPEEPVPTTMLMLAGPSGASAEEVRIWGATGPTDPARRPVWCKTPQELRPTPAWQTALESELKRRFPGAPFEVGQQAFGSGPNGSFAAVARLRPDTWIALSGKVSPAAEVQKILDWGQALDEALGVGGIPAAFRKAVGLLDAKAARANKVVLHVFLPSPPGRYLHLWLRARPAATPLPDGFPALEDGKRFHHHQVSERFTQDLAWAGDLPLVAAATERVPARHFGEPPPTQSELVKLEATAFVGRYDVTLETPDISEVKGLRRRLESLVGDLFPELKATRKR